MNEADNDSLPDTLLGYPIVYCDDMPTETVAMITFGPPLVVDILRPLSIAVSDGNGHVLTGVIEWRDNDDEWVGTVVWDEEDKVK